MNETDEVVAWLQAIRDYEGALPRAKRLAGQAIDLIMRVEPPHKLAVRGDAHRDRLLAARLNLRGATE